MNGYNRTDCENAIIYTRRHRPHHVFSLSVDDIVTIVLAAFVAGVVTGALKALIWG